MSITALLVSVGLGAWALAEGPAKGPPVSIVGTVVDADRRPAAGAGVYYAIHRAGGGWGTVVARAEADAQGRFRLEVPGEPGGGPEPGTLWAYRPGALAAMRRIARETLPPDWPVSMVIDEPARAEFLVRGPDGRPVAGARIEPRALYHPPFSVPDGLAERIAAHTVTDARGRAVLGAVFPEELITVFVTAPGLGRQYSGINLIGSRPKVWTIDMKPVGRVEGQVIADDPAIARNRKLDVTVWDSRRGKAVGLFDVVTDAQGRFAVAEAPAGELSADGRPPAGSPWFLRSPAGLKVEAGRTTRIEVRAVKGLPLRGIVRERDTGRPIAGVGIGPLTAPDDDSIVYTDAEGRFALFALEGANLRPDPIPAGHARLHFGLGHRRAPEGAAVFEWPPIELSRAGTVRGIVVDERGEPVPGATVRAAWPVNEGAGRAASHETRAIAGGRGEFLVDRVVDGEPVKLSAIAPDGRRTTGVVESRAGAEPARLVVEPARSVSLAGRVVDAAGRRIAGARVHLRVRERLPGGRVKGDELVEIRGAHVIRSGDNGWFRTPLVLDPDREYAAIAEADGYEPARTDWTKGTARTFPELVLRPRVDPGTAAVAPDRPPASRVVRDEGASRDRPSTTR